MSLARTLLKLSIYQPNDPLNAPYDNDGLPQTVVTSIGSALNYIIASIFPNARDAVATEGDLPLAGNDINDYRIVLDYNSTGQAAGYRWEQREGQAAPQWNLVQNFDSTDSILQQWQTNASGIFVQQLGVEDVAGQTIYGSTLANGDLTLSPNGGDGTNDPLLQTGFINLFGDTRPLDDNAYDLGTSGERFASMYVAGLISDGTASVTVAQMLVAYQHSQITTGNPHQVNYEEVLNRLGNVTFGGDVDALIIDFSTQGDKTITLNVVDDSHNHTTSTITDFEDATWALLKARLIDTADASWTFNDGLKTAALDITVDTTDITDIASPSINKTLVSNPAGDEWVASDGTVELTGDVSGSGTYNSTTDKVSFAATVDNVAIQNIDRINIENLAVSIAIDSPATVTLAGHGMQTGRKVRLVNTSYDGEHVITVVDANSFTIPVDNSLGGIEVGYIIPNNSQFLYDSFSDEWLVQLENAQLSHHELSNLTNSDDHTQYNHILGRTDGLLNKVTGGEIANGNLYLRSTSHATKGDIRFEDNVLPQTPATYSAGWTGLNLGSAARRINNIYLAGEISHLRVEQLASLPTASIQEIGRLVHVIGGDYYINKNGVNYRKIADETQKGIANGYAPLNGSTKIDTIYLPSYVDDVLEYADLASFPVTGETGKIYVALDTNKTYRWSGSAYVEISSSDVNSVNGLTGIVTLDSDDITEAGNLYFTDTRAKTAAVLNTLAGTETDQAPSVAAVNAAIASATPGYEQEAPTGTVNGVNVTFSISVSPSEDKAVQLFQSGLMQRQGIDYTISGTTITMTTAPQFGQDLWAYYTKG